MATRWRWPPESAPRERVQLATVQADLLGELRHARGALARVRTKCSRSTSSMHEAGVCRGSSEL